MSRPVHVHRGASHLSRSHAFEARHRVLFITLSRAGCGVDASHNVMHHLRVPRAQLQSPDIARRLDRQRNDKGAEYIRAFRRRFSCQRIGPGHGNFQIRLSQQPAGRPFRHAGEMSRIPFHGSLRYPLLEHPDLFVAEPPFPDELAIAGFGLPGRHVATLRDRDEQPSPLLYVPVAEQIKRPRPARPVTGGAMLEHDGSDMPVEGQPALWLPLLPGLRRRHRAEENQSEPQPVHSLSTTLHCRVA